MDFLAIPPLRGALASIEPLTPEHAEELAAAVAEDELYKLWYTRLPSPDRMSAEIEKRLAGHAAGQVVPWTIRAADGRAVGMTTLLNIRPDHRRLEIGSTWIAPSAQGTGLNTQVKLLQLTHAFETLNCIAVEFRTHWHNHRSRAAIAALGAKQDGDAAQPRPVAGRDHARRSGVLHHRLRVAHRAAVTDGEATHPQLSLDDRHHSPGNPSPMRWEGFRLIGRVVA